MSPEHEELRDAYVADLREAMKLAENWWKAMAGAKGRGTEAAHAAARARWPDGPASHPAVIAVMVKYMFACDALNRRLGRAGRTALNKFLIDSLDGSDSQDLDRFTLPLSYWPLSRGRGGRPE